MKRIRNILLIISIMSSFIVPPVFAQEATAEPVAEVPTIVSDAPPPENSQDAVFDSFVKVSGIASLVALVVSLLKRFPFLNFVPSQVLSFGLTITLTVGYMIAREYGGGAQFQNATIGATTLIETVLNVMATYFGASAIYKGATMTKFPILSYKRPTA